MMEYWVKKGMMRKVVFFGLSSYSFLFNPVFQHSNIPLFQSFFILPLFHSSNIFIF